MLGLMRDQVDAFEQNRNGKELAASVVAVEVTGLEGNGEVVKKARDEAGGKAVEEVEKRACDGWLDKLEPCTRELVPLLQEGVVSPLVANSKACEESVPVLCLPTSSLHAGSQRVLLQVP